MDQKTQLDAALQTALDKRRQNATLRSMTTNYPTSTDFSSNDFLSLAPSSDLRTAFLNELSQNPSFTLGSGGSRLLDGNSTYAERLEQDIASFHNAPSALLCNSGFDANAGIFSVLPQPGDIIIYDEYIHASVHDGMRVSRAARRLPFAHNSVSSLERVLHDCLSSDPSIHRGEKSVFIALEAIYSMDGDIAPLAAIVSLTKTILPNGNGHIVLDEAHATGILGPNGRGLACSLGLEADIAVRLHTFGKAMACNGAVILCSPLMRAYLINYARTLIYTTFMSFPALAAIRAAYSLLMAGKTDILAARLQRNISSLYEQLLDLQHSLPAPAVPEARSSGQQTIRPLIQVPSACPLSPIFSVESLAPKSLAQYCQAQGLIVRPIMPPTVPVGSERIRVCLHAGNTDEDIARLVGAVRTWCQLQLQPPEKPKL